MLNVDSLKRITDAESPQALSTASQTSSENNKILPIPIIRVNLPNSSKIRTKLRANGYKNFSKISAGGPDTLLILKNIHQSQSLKFTQKFEFDPYQPISSLCDSSCLTELGLVLKKLKNIKQLCLIIRRIEDSAQTNKICPAIYKLIRLKRIRLEFLSMSNLKESHLISIHSALQRCYLLNSLNWKVVENPVKTLKYFESIARLLYKLKKLEHVSDYITITKGLPFSDFLDLQTISSLPKMHTVKNFDVIYLVSKEWAHIGENGDIAIQLFANYIAGHSKLERFTSRYIRSNVPYQDILSLLQSFVSLVHFRHLEFEFLNCAIGDTELVAFAYGLSRLPQLKYVRLKILQNIPLSIDYIEKFIDKVSAMENIEKFDFYFRKQFLSSRETPRLQKIFSQYKDVHCSFGQQSLHLFRNKTLNSSNSHQ